MCLVSSKEVFDVKNGEPSSEVEPDSNRLASGSSETGKGDVAAGKQTTARSEGGAETIAGEAPAVSPSSNRTDASPPKALGRYEVVKVLGEGAFGTVYLARDSQLKREVAVKVPREGVLGNKSAIERFFREAQAAATISHPNICPVFDVGEADGRNYIVMAYIDGRPLSDFVRESKGLAPRAIASQVRKIALALQVAHDKGIVHRDLKPANIMIERERQEPIVMDFGLAQRAEEEDAKLTREGAILGTPAYMSPEQAGGEGAEVGPLADVYSLGVILYELLAGEVPFTGPLMAVLAQVLNAEPISPSVERENVDPRLETICLKAMAKKPENRYQSMKQLADALRGYLRTPAPTSSSPTQARTAKDVSGKKPKAGVKTKVSARQRPASNNPTVISQQKKKKRQTAQSGSSQIKEPKSPPQTAEKKPSSVKTYVVIGVFTLALGGCALGVYALISHLGRGGEVQLKFTGLPADGGITLWMDDKKLSRSDTLKPLPLATGNHQLQVKRDDLILEDRWIRVETGESKTVSVDVGAAIFEHFELPTAKNVLAARGTITILAGDSSREIRAEEELPKDHFVITGIDLVDVGKAVDIRGTPKLEFGRWADLSALKTLSLRDGELSDPMISSIIKVSSLRSLDLTGSNVNDDAVKKLAGMDGLEELTLDRTPITDTGIGHLTLLKSLTALSLDGTAITDASLESLTQMGSLESLTVTSTKLSGSSVFTLKSALQGCAVRHDSIVDPVQQKLVEWVLTNGGTLDIETEDGEELHILNSGGLPVTGYFVVGVVFPQRQSLNETVAKQLANSTKLRKLSFGESHLKDDEVQHIAQIDSLESLDLRATPVTFAGLAELKGLPNLNSLILDGSQIGEDGLDALGQLPQLTLLFSDGPCEAVTDWSHISGLKKLKTLSLTNAGLDNSAAKAIASLTGIKELDLSGNPKLTDDGIAELQTLMSLEILSLRGTGLSDASIPHLISLKSLKDLNTTETKFSFTGVSSVERALRGCRVVGGVAPSYLMDLETPAIGSLPAGWTGDSAMRIVELHGLRAISSAQAGETQVTSPEFRIDGDFFVQMELLNPSLSQFSFILLGDRGPDLTIGVTPKNSYWQVTVPRDDGKTTTLLAPLRFSPAQFRVERRGNAYSLSVDGFVLRGIATRKATPMRRIEGTDPQPVGGSSFDSVMLGEAISFSTTRFKRFRGIRFANVGISSAKLSANLSYLKLGPLSDARIRRVADEEKTQFHVLDTEAGGIPEGWKFYPGKDVTHARLQLAKCDIRGDFVVRFRMQKLQAVCAFQMRLRGKGEGGDLPLAYVEGVQAGAKLIGIGMEFPGGVFITRMANAQLVFPGNDPISHVSRFSFVGFQIARKGDVISVQVDGKLVATLRSSRYRDFRSIDFDMQDIKFSDFEIRSLTGSTPPVGPGPEPPKRKGKRKKKTVPKPRRGFAVPGAEFEIGGAAL